MARIVTKDQRIVTAGKNPGSVYSRVFGLACKCVAGTDVSDLAYSPPLGKNFWLRFMSIWYGGGDHAGNCGGTIYIASGTGIPTESLLTANWEIIVPFWAGTTKPAIMVQGREGYLSLPISRLYAAEALRFGMVIENFSNDKPFWVNAWFEISEG